VAAAAGEGAEGEAAAARMSRSPQQPPLRRQSRTVEAEGEAGEEAGVAVGAARTSRSLSRAIQIFRE